MFTLEYFIDDWGIVLQLSIIAGALWAIFNTPFLQSSHWEASIGQKLLRIQITDIHGNELSFWRACYRQSLLMFCSWGILMYFFSPDKQCLHDFLCHSLVINKGTKPTNTPRRLYPIRYSIIVIAVLISYVFPILLLINYILN